MCCPCPHLCDVLELQQEVFCRRRGLLLNTGDDLRLVQHEFADRRKHLSKQHLVDLQDPGGKEGHFSLSWDCLCELDP